MRKEVTHYQGKEITEDIIKKMRSISIKVYEKEQYDHLYEKMDNIREICYYHGTNPSEENVILGEDFFITYAIRKSSIEIFEWVALKNVENKLIQTIEMFNQLKKILLQSEGIKISVYLRHITSYPFYELFQEKGYFEEIHDYPQIEYDKIPYTRNIIKEILRKYGSLYNYLKSNSKEYSPLEEYIYHEITFKINDKFIKKYKKAR